MHNLREIPAERTKIGKIDPMRTRENQILVGHDTSSEVKLEYDAVIKSANLLRKIRRDAVLGIEAVFSLPNGHKLNEEEFFNSCIEWCRKYFGIYVLSAIVHRDEACPHCHIILIPLVNSSLQGSKLYGNRTKMRAMHEHFYENVGVFFGLTKPRPTVRYPSEYRMKIATEIVGLLSVNEESMRDSAVQNELVQLVSRDPMDLAEIIGIVTPRPVIKDYKTYAL
ncbi:plasmid recombination protein [Polynucleobacter arcticus]|nr:plasmid recombination protein [Polynucleobacter arcticus]